MNFDLNYVENIELANVDMMDYPDFSDAYIIYAEYKSKEMTVEELDELNDVDGFVHDCVMNDLF